MLRPAKVDVIIASADIARIGRTVESLRHLPFNADLTVLSGRTWEDALNEAVAKTTKDVIFIDDDAWLTEDTFKNWDYYYPLADIFGFKLLFENGEIQHAGGLCKVDRVRETLNLGHYGYRQKNRKGLFDMPCYVFHVAPAVGYIKRHVLDDVGKFPDMEEMPGLYYRDVDWSFRAMRKGYKSLYIPNIAYHNETRISVNINPENSDERSAQNFRYVVDKHVEMILEADKRFPEFIKLPEEVAA